MWRTSRCADVSRHSVHRTYAYLCTHCMQRRDNVCIWQSYVYLCRLFLGLPTGLKASWGCSGITGSSSISHYHFSSCGFSAHPRAPHSAGLMAPTLPVSLRSWNSKVPLGTVRLIGNRTLIYRSWSALPRDPTLKCKSGHYDFNMSWKT